METTRKNKVTKEPAVNEAIVAEEVIDASQQLVQQEAAPQQAQPQQERPTIKQLLAEAPELYGISPSADEIEQFKQRETTWRIKLGNLQ